MSEKLWIGCLRVGPIETNCYILKEGQEGKEAVLIDPGDDAERILDALETAGAEPSAILLTHGHYDHILAVNAIRDAYPSCRILAGELERPMLENSSLNTSFFRCDCVVTPDEYLADGQDIELLGRTFRVLSTPGHTAGSICFYTEADGILFSGDTIFCEGYGRTDLPTGSTKALMESLRTLLTMLPEETVILPGHGGRTTVSHERLIEGFAL